MPAVVKNFKSPFKFSKKMVWVLIFGYGLFIVGQTTYQNYQMNKDISEEKAKITALEKKKKILQLSLIYYASNSYREVEARRRLGLKGQDEHVVALPQASSEPVLSVASVLQKNNPVSKPVAPYIAWWRLFFSKEN